MTACASEVKTAKRRTITKPSRATPMRKSRTQVGGGALMGRLRVSLGEDPIEFDWLCKLMSSHPKPASTHCARGMCSLPVEVSLCIGRGFLYLSQSAPCLACKISVMIAYIHVYLPPFLFLYTCLTERQHGASHSTRHSPGAPLRRS